jgi:hypothetical protein
MLKWVPAQRATAEQALQHPWLRGEWPQGAATAAAARNGAPAELQPLGHEELQREKNEGEHGTPGRSRSRTRSPQKRSRSPSPRPRTSPRPPPPCAGGGEI